jgi:thiol-disulfide isomerase/thioredoxin
MLGARVKTRARSLKRFLLHPASLTAALFALGCVTAVAMRARRDASACEAPGAAACAMPHGNAANAKGVKKEEGDLAALPSGPVVVAFTSEYCPACRRLEPVLDDARTQCSRAGAAFVRMDVESVEGGALASRFRVTGTPTVVFLDSQHGEVARFVGAQPLADVRRAIESAYGFECAALPRIAPSSG